MPSKKARATKPTPAEKKAAKELQAPSMRAPVQPPVNIAFDVFRKKMNEGRYADQPQLEWTNGASLEGVAFFVHRTFKFRSSQNGAQIGFEISTETPDGERLLLGLSMNEERKAFHEALTQWRRENKARPYVGPMTVQLIESSNPAHKPYTRFVDVDE